MEGSQRLSVERLQQFEKLGYGMFIHFGMSTFDGAEYSLGDKPSTHYAPTDLDVEQWVRVASESGMKYAILTTKHVSGHCLWPSAFTDYHVGTSGDPTDVVGEFVKACRKYNVKIGFYYCSLDNHHLMGSLTAQYTAWEQQFTTEEYQQFQMNQIEELMTRYGAIDEMWIDIPFVLPRGFRHKLYNRIAELQPDIVIVMNHGMSDGSRFDIVKTWPSDVITIERHVPDSAKSYVKWREIEGKKYYMPGEVGEPIGKEWFYVEGDHPRSDEELLGMYLLSRSRSANFVLNIGPDKSGKIPAMYVEALARLKANIINVCGEIK